MSKKLILFFFGIVFFFSWQLAHAGLVINEIMYNPLGDDLKREWIEVFNNGTENVTITSGSSNSAWRFDDGGTSLHYVNDQLIIPGGGYAIFASDTTTFLSEYSTFSGLIADTTMSLDNSGLVKILNGDNPRLVISSQSYDLSSGANNDGKSLQRQNDGLWKAALPTPGTVNETTTSSVPSGNGGLLISSTNSDTSPTQNTTTTETKTKTIEEQKIKAQITTKTLGFAGVPLSFQATAFRYKGEKLQSGKYFWNFGDGDSKEIQANAADGQKFTHTYFYPGEYNVSLEYYSNYYGDIPDATDKMTIKVIPADIIISKVGDEKDFFVELTNNTNYDADISKWTLVSDRKSFVLPQNTILSSKNKIIISAKITGFSNEDKNTLKLTTPQGETVFAYLPSPVLLVEKTEKNKNSAQISASKNLNQNKNGSRLAKKC